jgi:hypothetical protein
MYFKRASRIAEKSEDFGWRDLAEAKLALADFYTFTETQNRSRKLYKEIWELLSEGDDRLAFRSESFADPVAIRTDTLPVFAGGKSTNGSSRSDLISGRIIVTYDVSSRGRVRELQTEAIPAEFTDMQRMVHREIRRRIYRPRIADGDAVDAKGLVFEHPFSYDQAELDALKADAEADTQQEAERD